MWKVGGVGVLVMEEISEGKPAGFVIRWVGKGAELAVSGSLTGWVLAAVTSSEAAAVVTPSEAVAVVTPPEASAAMTPPGAVAVVTPPEAVAVVTPPEAMAVWGCVDRALTVAVPTARTSKVNDEVTRSAAVMCSSVSAAVPTGAWVVATGSGWRGEDVAILSAPGTVGEEWGLTMVVGLPSAAELLKLAAGAAKEAVEMGVGTAADLL
ncbi:hypothetical protein CYMTET_40219 [Cymbomonas tetramitiformis]|uniref:Uncharacterized protein n=1 Tax=Cymbomonas tetramitiformis TaxID=36881 RepID=A0AAE0F3Q2_9CHLO|nr:hypothetical protein CYMTET_40219 [Cymbomonas tetramitiformis]